MPYITIYQDVVFIEGAGKEATRKRKIKANLSGFGAQLKSLNDVKKNLSNQTKAIGCNCVIDFVYGQKSSWMAIDNVKFYGAGEASILNERDYQKIISEIK